MNGIYWLIIGLAFLAIVLLVQEEWAVVKYRVEFDVAWANRVQEPVESELPYIPAGGWGDGHGLGDDVPPPSVIGEVR